MLSLKQSVVQSCKDSFQLVISRESRVSLGAAASLSAERDPCHPVEGGHIFRPLQLFDKVHSKRDRSEVFTFEIVHELPVVYAVMVHVLYM